MIETVFVLMILICLMSLSLSNTIHISSYEFQLLKDKLLEAQYSSSLYHQKTEITLSGSSMIINEKSFDFSSLRCDHAEFHYTEQGTISNACTIRCYGNTD